MAAATLVWVMSILVRAASSSASRGGELGLHLRAARRRRWPRPRRGSPPAARWSSSRSNRLNRCPPQPEADLPLVEERRSRWLRLPFQPVLAAEVEAGPVGGAGGADDRLGRASALATALCTRGELALGLEREGDGIERRARPGRRPSRRRPGPGPVSPTSRASSASAVGQVGLGLDQVEPGGAQRHQRAQRVRARGRAGVELGDRDLELLLGPPHAGLADPDELGRARARRRTGWWWSGPAEIGASTSDASAAAWPALAAWISAPRRKPVNRSSSR